MARLVFILVAVMAVMCLGCAGNSADVAPQSAGQIGDLAFTFAGKNEQGYEEYRHRQTGIVFVKIPGGTFNMGSDDDSSYEKPVHEVALNGFLISKCEITQAVWQKTMGNNPSRFKGDDHPVEMVSWDDCREFCEKTGLRLPTEAEWEYACRAGTTTKYYWGDEPDGEYMWYYENSGETTRPVGQKRPNGFGLYDMSGNVWEWCQDLFTEDYRASSTSEDPAEAESWDYRVCRGDAWRSGIDGELDYCCRSSIRGINTREPMNSGISHVGFRCVVSK